MPRLLIGILLVLGAGGVAQSLLWQWAEGRVEQGYERWRVTAQEAGWVLTAEPPIREGWPFAAVLRVPHPAISGGERWHAGGLSWRAESVALRASVFHPTELRLELTGDQLLRLGNDIALPYTASRFSIAEAWNSHAVTVQIKNLTIQTPALGKGDAFKAADITLHTTFDEPTLVSARIEAIDLPAHEPWPLGPHLASLSLDMALSHAALLSDSSAAGDLQARLAAWRDHAGALTIQHLALGWGPLGLSGHAVLTLDAGLQPAATATAHLLGANETLDMLASRNVLPPQTAVAAKGIAALLSHTPEGGAPELDVPVTLEHGTLAVSGIPVAKLP